MSAGVSRWEHDDPAIVLDAQIAVLRRARADVHAELPQAEELAVRAMTLGDQGTVDRACALVEDLRAAAHDFSVEIDELQTERRQLLPTQRCPTSQS